MVTQVYLKLDLPRRHRHTTFYQNARLGMYLILWESLFSIYSILPSHAWSSLLWYFLVKPKRVSFHFFSLTFWQQVSIYICIWQGKKYKSFEYPCTRDMEIYRPYKTSLLSICVCIDPSAFCILQSVYYILLYLCVPVPLTNDISH